jgi:co-chaperonin GroES (HSP10)
MSTQTVFVKPDSDVVPDIPVKPLGWRVLIRPYRPDDTSAGGIAIPEEALEATEILTFIGQIVDMGNLAFTAKTRSGILMADIEPKPQVGDWVMYGQYGGQNLRLRNGQKYVMMNDDGIMGVARDPKEFLIYL